MRKKIRGGILICAVLAGFSLVRADEPQVITVQTEGTPPTYNAPAAAPATPATAPGQPVKPVEAPGEGGPDKKPPEGGKPGDQPGRPGEPPGRPGEGGKKPGDTKPEEAPKPIPHPTKPPSPPNPKELDIVPTDGKVRFNFNGQPWPGVLECLARISGMSLDWQEMPGDYLNLSTQRDYNVAEMRDLINQHLLARGFTLLSHGETLSVANVKKLDLSLVPRVEPQELEKHAPYEFVKVSLQLNRMTAEAAVEELKPMLSPNGKLIPLKLTNRIEAVDAVVNLREVYALLKSEQSPSGPQHSVKEFKLKYARAEEVREQLEALLGKEKAAGMPQMPGGGGQAMTPEMMQQIQQQQQEMMARRGGGNPEENQQPGARNKPPSPQAGMFFVINQRKNSILAYAPPDKMALIEEVVATLDVPSDTQESLLANVSRTRVYRLTGVEPETLVKTLREIGNLDPTTNMQVDKKNKAIIVFGPLVDHAIISALVEKLSGSERRFEVIRLRRLAADYVAGTVEFMINGEKKDKSNNRSSFYNFYDRYSSSNEQKETASGFRVDADVEHNRLLLWANDVELADVENLLRKLGEMPAEDAKPQTFRVIDTADSQAAKTLLERMKRAWPSVSPNPLEINSQPGSGKTPENITPEEKLPEKQPIQSSAMQLDEKTPATAASMVPIALAQLRDDSPLPSKTLATKTRKPAPPVRVEVTPDGQIAVSSDDPEALDLFEDMAAQLADEKKEYKVFRLKYVLAYGVSQNLEDFFKGDDKKSGRSLPRWIEYEYGIQSDTDDKSGRLSKRRPLKFISDADTNSILVQGATPKQLKTIEELIELYDQPTPSDAQSVRKTESIPLEFSKADVVADTIKDVYRDLLSTNDKTFGGKNDRDSNRGFFFSFDSEDDKKKEQKTPKFKGLLSIGVDELSNTIVVSAPAYLFEQIKKMILDLDRAAAPATQMKVIKLGPGMRGPDIQRQLLEALGQDVPKEDASKKNGNPEEGRGPPNKKDGKKNGNGGAKKS